MVILLRCVVVTVLIASLGVVGCASQRPARVVEVRPTVKRMPPKHRSKPQVNTAYNKAEPKRSAPNNTRRNVASNSSPELKWGWPAQGGILTKFSAGQATFKGIDIGGNEGTPIYSAGSGEVVYSGNSLRGYGNLIIIKHNKNFLTAYAHNRINMVKEGDRVTLGQRIAEMGRTGTDKVKLHFEVRYQGKPIDPQTVLPAR